MSGEARAEPLFGIFPIPESRELDKIFEIVSMADRSSIDLVTIQDHPYQGAFLDTWTLLANLAAVTTNVHLMTNVADLPLRHPPVLAKSAATLDILSKGRVELGVGAGAFWRAIVAYGGQSRTPGEAVSALEEAIRVMRLIWADKDPKERVSFPGRFYRLDGAHPGPKPPHPIRVWIGGLGPRMLRLTGRLGDGWSVSLGYAPPDQIPRMQRTINEAATTANRRVDSIRRMYNVGGIIDDGKGSYSDLRQQGLIVGSPDHWAKTLAQYYGQLALDTFTFAPVVGNTLEQFRVFADEVVPKARTAIEELHATAPALA